jgi:hypothetical protein
MVVSELIQNVPKISSMTSHYNTKQESNESDGFFYPDIYEIW